MRNYTPFKADSKGNPIEGTDRIFTGESRRKCLSLLAFEEGIKLNPNDICVRLPNGDSWFVYYLSNVNKEITVSRNKNLLFDDKILLDKENCEKMEVKLKKYYRICLMVHNFLKINL